MIVHEVMYDQVVEWTTCMRVVVYSYASFKGECEMVDEPCTRKNALES